MLTFNKSIEFDTKNDMTDHNNGFIEIKIIIKPFSSIRLLDDALFSYNKDIELDPDKAHNNK